ncbi:MAG: transcription antitermination factor NusB [Armatimonadetes bacterium]|nr:transcription antitermination factor NusB [Armatimonadota bacterium]
MHPRRTARELILRILYQIEVGRIPTEDVLQTVAAEVRPPEEDWGYAQEIVRGVAETSGALDQIIEDLAQGWRLERLAKVDKSVLRMALYELQHHPELPVSMVVNDAVEIARKYSMDESPRFVNGILGSFLRRPPADSPPPIGCAVGADAETVETGKHG